MMAMTKMRTKQQQTIYTAMIITLSSSALSSVEKNAKILFLNFKFKDIEKGLCLISLNNFIKNIDHCNSLLFGASSENIDKKLQRVRNNAARLIFKLSKRSHITPFLKELH